jgi:hypothetical protein
MLGALKCMPTSWHKDRLGKENAMIYHNAVKNKKASSPCGKRKKKKKNTPI